MAIYTAQLDSHRKYTVAWISALPIERAAATMMLDERHLKPLDFKQPPTDTNTYTWGKILEHNVVITSLSSGVYGTTIAATTAMQTLSSIPSIRLGLLVGIGAGIPRRHADVRLGDIVVSQPSGNTGGVFQYDLGKTGPSWQRRDFLNRPPEVLLKALANLQAEHEMNDPLFASFLTKAAKRNTKWGRLYSRPETESDRLFDTQTEHVPTAHDCSECGTEIVRRQRESLLPYIHYGTIGSGNSLVKDAISRDKIAEMEPNCFCLEMEAAGLMNTFPCVVIRGICDYADSHKNDNWQRYAAAVSAAYAKELLWGTPFIDLEDLQPAAKAIQSLQAEVSNLTTTLQQTRSDEEKERLQKCISTFYTCPYMERKDRNIRIIKGTCNWFLTHDRFCDWLNNKASSLLWTSADPGCGKSVLARHLVDVVLRKPSRIIVYFFFKDDFPDQRSSASAVCAILHQLFQQAPSLFLPSIVERMNIYGEKIKDSFSQLWEIFLDVTGRLHQQEMICVVDALDECLGTDRALLIDSITKLALASRKNPPKFLLTSRPYDDIRRGFNYIETLMPVIHLSGEGETETQAIVKEINMVVAHRVHHLSSLKRLQPDENEYLMEQLTNVPNRTYLWVHLVLDLIETTPGFTRGHVKRCISALPRSVDEAYEKILSRTSNERAARKIFGIILGAYVPLTAEEMGVLLVLHKHESPKTLEDDLEPAERMQTTIRDICGLFTVIIDSKVYFLHQTAREFLMSKSKPSDVSSRLSTDSNCSSSSLELIRNWHWRHSISLPNSHKFLAMCCLKLLQWSVSSNYVPIWRRIQVRDSERPVGLRSSNVRGVLHDYSSVFWIKHFLESGIHCSQVMKHSALKICKQHSRCTWLPGYLNAQKSETREENLIEILPTLSLTIYLRLIPLVELLAEGRSNVNITDKVIAAPLWWAAKSGDISVVHLLLHNGAKLDGRQLFPDSSPLCEASRQGFDAIVQKLLSHQAKLDSQDSDGRTALYHAATAGHLSTVQLLFNAGARLDLQGRDGNDALLSAATAGHENVVEFLVERGASIEARNNYDETPLFAASRKGHDNVAKILLTHGANVDSTTNSLIFLAAKIYKTEGTRSGVTGDNGNWPYILNRSGSNMTPLLAACTCGHHDTVVTLLHHKADPRKPIDGSRNTLLHLYPILRQHHIVKLLLDAGADICAEAEGRGSKVTPRMIVKANGLSPTCKLFMQHDGKSSDTSSYQFWGEQSIMDRELEGNYFPVYDIGF